MTNEEFESEMYIYLTDLIPVESLTDHRTCVRISHLQMRSHFSRPALESTLRDMSKIRASEVFCYIP